MTPSRRHSAAAMHRRPWVSALALLALVWAQTLALVHGVVHVPGHESVSAVADHVVGHAQGDEQGLDCQLFDQIAQSGGVAAETAALPRLAAQHLRAPAAAPEVAAKPHFAFHARGPPRA
jgi:hypothetical protein